MASSSGKARQLWLLRHAKTLQDPPPGGADRERRLAPRGERDADALGACLARSKRHGKLAKLDGLALPGLVLSSSAARAAETARRVWAAVEDPPTITYLDSLYAATPKEVLRHVRQAPEGVGAVMVVGHNPSAQQLALELVNGHDKAGRKRLERHSLQTCALAVYRIDAESWDEVDLGTATLVELAAPPY